MNALPDEPLPAHPPDPERILSDLPEIERAVFLAQYRRAVDDARDPGAWKDLQRFLHLWALRAVAMAEPGYYEARDAARAGRGPGVLLEDAIRQYRADR